MTARAYLALGSNLDDRAANLQRALDGLAATDGVRVVAVSGVYETDPVGPAQPDYLNAVVALDTDLDARALLGKLRREAQPARRKIRVPRTWALRQLEELLR